MKKFGFTGDDIAGVRAGCGGGRAGGSFRVRFGEHPFELEVELHARQAERMADQQLGLEPRVSDALRGEKGGCSFENLKQCEHEGGVGRVLGALR